MKRLFALIFLSSLFAYAGLPPTTSKLSGDTSNVTTFNFQFPNFTGTHTGPNVSLGVNSVAGGGTGTNSFTTGSIPFMGASAFSQDNNNLFWDNTNKRLGIGVQGTTPSAPLDVHSSTGNPIAQFNNTGAQGASAGGYINAVSDPGVAMLSGSRLGILGFAGTFDASHTIVNGGSISAFATENWTSTTRGTKLNFYTTTNGTTGQNIVLTLDNDKSASFTGNLNVTGSTTLASSLTGPLHATSGLVSASAINLASTDVSGVLPIANGGTNNGSLAVTAGGALYTDGTKIVNVGAGSAGQVLTSNGASAPTWAAVSAAAPSESHLLQNLTIHVTVASNAMTISLKQADGVTDPTAGSPSTIAFRSSGSGNGNSSYVLVNATSATSITIPSGATLGSSNASQYRIFVAAMNNAGTIELSVSGGNLEMDEINNMATLAISGTSNANNTWYSTTARSGNPYRIIGWIDVNETTAGTWASLPVITTLTMQAFSASAIGGYGQAWTDETGSRAFGTVYLNNTGRPIEILVTSNNQTGSTTNVVINGITAQQCGNGNASNAPCSISLIVPPNVSYEITQTGGATLNKWLELR